MPAIYIAGARPQIRHVLLRHGLRRPLVRYRADVKDASAAAHAAIAKNTNDPGATDLAAGGGG